MRMLSGRVAVTRLAHAHAHAHLARIVSFAAEILCTVHRTNILRTNSKTSKFYGTLHLYRASLCALLSPYCYAEDSRFLKAHLFPSVEERVGTVHTCSVGSDRALGSSWKKYFGQVLSICTHDQVLSMGTNKSERQV